MAKNSKGFCLFYDWMESLDELDPADAYAVIRAISRYNETGDDPTAGFKGALKAFVLNLYQQIRRAEEASAAKAEGARITNEKRTNAERTHSERIANAHPTDGCATDTNTDTNTNTENNNITPSNEGVAPARASEKRFLPPTVDEVREYANANGLRVDAEAFCDHYTGNGWKVGKNAMKDWRAAVRNWARRDGEFGRQPSKSKTSDTATSSFDTDDFFDAALRRTYADDPPDDPLVGELKAVYMTGVGA